MIEFIEKRDGTVVSFDKQKIVNAIIPAMKEANLIDYQYAIDIANKICNQTGIDIAKVEDVQDAVERELMIKYPETAKRYIIYREERSKIRNMKSDLMKQVKSKIYALDVKNDNANVDERCFGARKNEAANTIMKKIAVEEMLSEDVRKAWEDNLLYIHDLDFYMLGTHNCLFVDEEKLLKNGFNTRNGDVRGAKRLSTAMQLIAIIMQTNENNLFGGIGDIHIDRTLSSFVRMSFLIHFKDGLKYVAKDKKKTWEKFCETYGEKTRRTASIIAPANIFKEFHGGAYSYAMDMLDREGSQSAEALYHNLNTLESRPGLQLPFSSINFGLDTSFEGRFVTKKLLEASLDGVGKFHSTSIFPISIFQYKEDINDRPGTPNYDLYRLSLKSTAKSIYPNYVNCGWVTNIPDKHPTYIIEKPSNKREGMVQVQIRKDGSVTTFRGDINSLYVNLIETYGFKENYDEKENFFYLDTRFGDVEVYINNINSIFKDYNLSLDEYISKVNYISADENKENFEITTDDFEYDLYDIKHGLDIMTKVTTPGKYNDYNPDTEMATMGSCDGIERIKYKLDGEEIESTFEEAWEKITEKYGPVQDWKLAHFVDTPEGLEIYDTFSSGYTKVKRFICNEDIGVWNRVTFKSYDKTYKILLTNDHPLPTQRGRIMVKDLVYSDVVYEAITKTPVMVTNIEPLGFRNRFGYDVETESDHFDVSGINSHNCRTLIGYDRHGLGYIKLGRGNNFPITMILPKLGIKYGICLGERERPDIEGFKQELDRLLKLAEKSLLERYKIAIAQSPRSAYFMYDNGTIQGAKESLKADSTEPSLKHNTLSIGFIGIANTLYALFGKYQNQSDGVKDFGNWIVKHIWEFCKEASERNDMNFTCYATPAENCCYTIMTKLQKEFGKIKGVTDKDYLTNSYHVPVDQKISYQRKIDIESEYTKYSNAGNITYVELDANVMNNIDALETIVNYAMKNENIAYFALNHPIDNCMDCGFSGVIDNSCPKCGAPTDHIQRLRRVTGYLSADYKTRFNPGKQKEVEDRVVHSRYSVM